MMQSELLKDSLNKLSTSLIYLHITYTEYVQKYFFFLHTIELNIQHIDVSLKETYSRGS